MFKNKSKGFSLVELIVVIAILVVFAAILIPSLLQYTENSRAQKDVSAMDEVIHAFELALTNQDCYDEMLLYSCTNNYVTYTDSSGVYGQVIADGEFWAPDGSGRATTITFNPEIGPTGDTIYDLNEALVNDMTYGNGSVAQSRPMEGVGSTNIQCYFRNASMNGTTTGYTYNKVRQIVGDNILTLSQTYRNSSFTIFIRFSQKDSVTVADVSGSFNGTNLYEGAVASKGSGTSSYDESGNAIVTVTNPGVQDSEYIQTGLGGSGSFGSDYKSDTIIDNIQKESKHGFYSSLVLAMSDVNNDAIGENADCDFDSGRVAVTQNGDIYNVVILQNLSESSSVIIKKNVNLNMNKKMFTTTANVGIEVQSGVTNIYAVGSTLQTTHQNVSGNIRLVRSYSDIQINGGTFLVNVTDCQNARAISTDGGIAIINNIKVNCRGFGDSVVVGIISTSDKKTTINNADVNVICEHNTRDESVYGIYLSGGPSKANNCNVFSSGIAIRINNCTINGGNYSSYNNPISIMSYFEANNIIKNATFKNFEISDDICSDTVNGHCPHVHDWGLGATLFSAGTHIYIDNCTFESSSTRLYFFKVNNDGLYYNLHISNTQVNGFNILSRNGSIEHDIYIGQGCNFDSSIFTNPSNVHKTNEIYKK